MGLQWAWAVEIAANLAVFPILGPEGLVGILSFIVFLWQTPAPLDGPPPKTLSGHNLAAGKWKLIFNMAGSRQARRGKLVGGQGLQRIVGICFWFKNTIGDASWA